MVSRLMALVTVLLAAALAQSPAELFEKAPPQVDEALRARVTRFYQAHVEGKFRVADQYVAEDSKDAFFSADKRRFGGFEITRISYSDSFAKARVVTTVDDEFVNPLGRYAVKMPLTTLWKLDQGEWFWYVVPSDGPKETPFGKMKAGEGGRQGKLEGIVSFPRRWNETKNENGCDARPHPDLLPRGEGTTVGRLPFCG